jgi:hypothetical protein
MAGFELLVALLTLMAGSHDQPTFSSGLLLPHHGSAASLTKYFELLRGFVVS